ncbi:RapZ C-terminal domain-containing protein [Streptomyces sp. NBC_01268]|uniref:RapZ C-terminal domain-containing protein n=1 Tax=Streptomyces sp. NBC_01268 TaxID=2903806 RepID=UPI002E357427|nr:RNase adapter RapZ [Streptomyces sp. NBC_01268]
MTTIKITSYGTGHRDDPTAANPVVVDTTVLHNPPDDPQVRATLTQLTGLHPDVAAYVLATPGAHAFLDSALDTIEQRARAEQHIDVHVHCYGGRHRSVAVAELLALPLHVRGHQVDITHRHINRPILPSRPRTSTDHR